MDTNHISLKYLWRFINLARLCWFDRKKIEICDFIAQYLGTTFFALCTHSRKLWWSDLAEIWTRASFYDYLKIYTGFFENFDFCQNGGHFGSKWWPFWIKNDRHFGKNQNFQKSQSRYLDYHKTKLWSKFQPNRMTTAAWNVHRAQKKSYWDIAQ